VIKVTKIEPSTLKQTSATKVIVGMSGGVDSSVSALLLQQQGYQVEGLFMKNWEEDAEDLGADYIATGHYCQRRMHEGKWQLIRGHDDNKDQSYFLYTLSHEHIAKTLFPIGEIDKPEVRKIAEQHNLVTHNKKDSTGICFIGERKFKDFLSQYLPAQPGIIETPEGEADHPRLYSDGLFAKQVHWVNRASLLKSKAMTVKTRYRQVDIPCTVEPLPSGDVKVIFDKSQKAVTPGQSAVFYDNDVCLGGAIIESYFVTADNTTDVSDTELNEINS